MPIDFSHLWRGAKHQSEVYDTPLGPREIRLLSFNRKSSSLSCDTTVASLDDELDFDAISYTWSGLDDLHRLTCNGVQITIPGNLYHLLSSLKASQPKRLFWCDAISINQNDSLEKNTQIPLMHKIYGQANQVLIWLGELSKDEAQAFAAIPQLLVAFDKIGDFSGGDMFQKLHKYNLPLQSSPVWEGIRDLMARKWWARLWVVQEVVLAHQPRFFYQDLRIDWDVMVGVVDAFWKYGLVGWLSTEEPSTHRNNGFEATSNLNIARDQYAENGYASPLPFMQGRKATNPVDKVFGILGFVDQQISSAVKVDVNLDITIVYPQFAKAWIATDSGLQMLRYLSSTTKHKGLPSWCPNFDSTRAQYDLGARYMYLGYHAGSPEVVTSLTAMTDTVFTPDSNKARFRGIIADRIAKVVQDEYVFPQSAETARKTLAWEIACLDLSRETTHTSKLEVPEMHWRALIANQYESGPNVVGGKRLPPAGAQLYRAWKKALRDCIERNIDVGLPYDEDHDAYMTNMEIACLGRRFFSTKDGRLGLGPVGIETGDIIAVLINSPTPFALRCISEEPLEYIIIGEVYVYGLMGGEALKMRDDGLAKEQILVIC